MTLTRWCLSIVVDGKRILVGNSPYDPELFEARCEAVQEKRLWYPERHWRARVERVVLTVKGIR